MGLEPMRAARAHQLTSPSIEDLEADAFCSGTFEVPKPLRHPGVCPGQKKNAIKMI